ncbi:MAG: tetratricopeptide repeat protein [Planctomycetes bacterium]|nr:tetratricopeptide repeat protein [Planctomycetota bacterium]
MRRVTPNLKVSILLVLGIGLIGQVLAGCVSSDEKLKDGPSSRAERERLASFHFNLARQFWERNRKNLALRYLDLSVRQDPTAVKSRLAILDIYLETGDAAGALDYLEQCPDTYREQPAFLKRRALALELQGEGEKAGIMLGRVAQLDGSGTNLQTAAADNLLLQGRTQEALSVLETAWRRHPEDADLLRSLTSLYEIMGRYLDAAEGHLSLARISPGEPEHLRNGARAFARAERIDLGLERIAELRRTSPLFFNGKAAAALGLLHFWKGDFEKALPFFEDAFAVPGFLPVAEELMAAAEIHLRAQRYLTAADLLSKTLEHHPENALARAALSLAYLRAGLEGPSRQALAQATDSQGHEALFEALKKQLEMHGHEDQSY